MQVNNQPSFGSQVKITRTFDKTFYKKTRIPQQHALMMLQHDLLSDGKVQKVTIGTQLKLLKQEGSILPKIVRMATMTVKSFEGKRPSARKVADFQVQEADGLKLGALYRATRDLMLKK
jgi:hypothetical protein